MAAQDQTLQDRIVVSLEITHGQPRVAGTRIMVYLVLNLLASGKSISEIISDDYYPDLTEEEIDEELEDEWGAFTLYLGVEDGLNTTVFRPPSQIHAVLYVRIKLLMLRKSATFACETSQTCVDWLVSTAEG